MCLYGKKDCSWKNTHTTNFHGTYKHSLTTFHLPNTYPHMKSLHHSNEITPEMAQISIISRTYQTVSTMTSTASSSGTANDVLSIKHFFAIAGFDK